MDSVKLMMEEHQYILRMLAVLRAACYRLWKEDSLDYGDFEKMIDFIRNYADSHHHGKEEKLLFHEMVTHLGALGNKLITHGMLVEHDFGRLYIRELEEALKRVKDGDDQSKLDVVANAIGYAQLLKRHIDKEDTVVYPFALKQLDSDLLDQVNRGTEEFELAALEQNIKQHYEQLVEIMESKYL